MVLFTSPGSDAARAAFARFANDRRLAASDCVKALADAATLEVLHDWWSNGWIHLDERPR